MTNSGTLLELKVSKEEELFDKIIAPALAEKLQTNTKNTTNRHYQEMRRLVSLCDRGVITKDEAVDTYKAYLLYIFGIRKDL